MESFLSKESVGILVKEQTYGNINEMLKYEKEGKIILEQERENALDCLAAAADGELTNLDADYILEYMRRKAEISYYDYCNEIENWIKEAWNNPNEREFWEIIPREKVLPTAIELIDFILYSYWNILSRKIKHLNFELDFEPNIIKNSVQAMVDAKWENAHEYYQLRYYSFQDELLKKTNFTDKKSAYSTFNLFGKEGETSCYSRCVLRRNSLIAGEWVVCSIRNNTSILDIRLDTTEWKVTYYDYEDYPIKSETGKNILVLENMKEEAVGLNALYVVILYRDSNMEFTIDNCVYNHGCEYLKLVFLIDDIITSNLQNKNFIYQEMLEKDQVESDAIES